MRQPTGAAEHEATMKNKLHAPTFAATVKILSLSHKHLPHSPISPGRIAGPLAA